MFSELCSPHSYLPESRVWHPRLDLDLLKLPDMQNQKGLPHRLENNGVSVFLRACVLSSKALHCLPWLLSLLPGSQYAMGSWECRKEKQNSEPDKYWGAGRVGGWAAGVSFMESPKARNLPTWLPAYHLFLFPLQRGNGWFTKLPTMWPDETNIYGNWRENGEMDKNWNQEGWAKR